MKKLFFLMLLFVFTANLTSAQVYMSRGEIDDMTRIISDFTHHCDEYVVTKDRASKKEISKGLFILAGKMKSYTHQFTKAMQSNSPSKNSPYEKLRWAEADMTDPYNQIVEVKLSMEEVAKLSQHSENLLRLKQIFKDNSYRINAGDRESMNNLEAFKKSAKVCLDLQKEAYMKAVNARN